MVIIDTSAWVEFFRRDGDLQVKLAVKGLLSAMSKKLGVRLYLPGYHGMFNPEA